MKKDLAIILGLFLLIAVLLVFGQGFTTTGFIREGTRSAGQGRPPGIVLVTVKTLAIEAEVAAKASDRKKGLVKRESLPLNRGMLFVFESKGPYGIWMKNMQFAIDIIWIDENRQIVDMAVNAPPQPGKKDRELVIYKPKTDAKYVLEINAGLGQFHGLAIGDVVNFEL